MSHRRVESFPAPLSSPDSCNGICHPLCHPLDRFEFAVAGFCKGKPNLLKTLRRNDAERSTAARQRRAAKPSKADDSKPAPDSLAALADLGVWNGVQTEVDQLRRDHAALAAVVGRIRGGRPPPSRVAAKPGADERRRRRKRPAELDDAEPDALGEGQAQAQEDGAAQVPAAVLRAQIEMLEPLHAQACQLAAAHGDRLAALRAALAAAGEGDDA